MICLNIQVLQYMDMLGLTGIQINIARWLKLVVEIFFSFYNNLDLFGIFGLLRNLLVCKYIKSEGMIFRNLILA